MIDPTQDANNNGLISFEDWLEIAIHQHPKRISIMLARTEPIRFKKLDQIDFMILYRDRNN